jgi:hypothetical protein
LKDFTPKGRLYDVNHRIGGLSLALMLVCDEFHRIAIGELAEREYLSSLSYNGNMYLAIIVDIAERFRIQFTIRGEIRNEPTSHKPAEAISR